MLERLLARFGADDALDEILVNGTSAMALVGRKSTVYESSPFADRAGMSVWVQDLAHAQGIRLDPLCAAAGGMLDSGYRWHALLPPLCVDGPLLSLRRHRFASIQLDHFAGDRAGAVQAASDGSAMLIAGPTGAGKTSFLSALLAHHALSERVVVVESLQELPALSPSWIRLVERRANIEGAGAISLATLLHEAMRLRPDRLVVGEIRGPEARTFLEALTTGHRGVMATIHAGSPEQAYLRLATLAGASPKKIERLLGGMPLVCVQLERGDPPRVTSCRRAS